MRKILPLLIIMFISINSIFAQVDMDHIKKLDLIEHTKSESSIDIASDVSRVNLDKLFLKSEEFGDVPDWKWESKFGGTGFDYARDIVTDSNGNIYIVGSYCGQITIESETHTSIGDREAIIAKFDNLGGLVWLKKIPAMPDNQTAAFGICIDNLDNIFVTGFYTGSVTIGTTDLPNNAVYNLFLTKLNSSGDVLMAVNHGNVGNTEIGLKLDIDDSGNIYIIGSTDMKTEWRHRSIILKYDSGGNLLWEQFHDEYFNDIRVGKSNIYFVGILENASDGNIDNNVSLILTGRFTDAFILKSDLDGDFLWGSIGSHSVLKSGDSYGITMDMDDKENLYLGGYFRNNVNFSSFELINSDELYTGYVTKCDSSGEFKWAKAFRGKTDDISLGDGKDIYIIADSITKVDSSGLFIWKNLDTNDSKCITISADNLLLAGDNYGLVYVSQADTSSVENWFTSIEGNSGMAQVIGMVADSKGNVYTYAFTSNEVDFFGTTISKGLFVSKQNYLGEVIWVNELHGVELSASMGNYIAIDPSEENIFITGEFTKSLKINEETTLTPDEGESIFIIKYSVDGTYKWNIQEDFESNNLCLSADYTGNVICSGVFYESINISGTNLLNAGGQDLFIAKYNANGNLLWAKRAGGDDTEYSGFISVDGSNNIYFIGEFLSENVTVDDTEIDILEGDGNIIYSKINPEGIVQWVKSFAGSHIMYEDSYSWATGIKTDEQGYSYIKGWHGDSTSFDDIMLYSPYGAYSYFIAKIDPNGTTVWANSIDEHFYGIDYNQMDIDEKGNVYFGAQAADSLHFGTDFAYGAVGYNDLFLAKYSSNGDLDWVKTMESAYGYLSSVAVWDTNFVFIGGYFKSDILFEDTEFLSAEYSGFLALVGTDNAKPVITSCAEDASINLNEDLELLVPDLTGNVESVDNFTLNSNLIITQVPEAGTYLVSDDGSTHEVTITVEDDDGNTETCTVILTGTLQTSIENLEGKNEELIIYPNPSSDNVHIKFENTELVNIELKVYDLYGRLILTKTSDRSNEIIIFKSEVQNTGIYLFRINNDQNYKGKIIFN